MKLTAMLLLGASLQISAKGIAQKIRLSERNAPMERIFSQIERQTDYRFVYTEDFLQKAHPATIRLSDATIEQVLDSCFRDQLFTYSILDRLVIIKEKLPSPNESPAVKGIDIGGTVSGKDGEAVSGASITVKGSLKGTMTNAEGRFTLRSVDSNAVLVISYIGYKTQEVPVNGRTVIDIQLVLNLQALSDVVIVGYGTQKKENLTAAVSTVSAKELDNRPIVNLAQGLQGLVPNLNINLNNGRPGTAANFNIRGITSLNNSNGNGNLGAPLVMVDGVQMDPNLINPAEVESVTVLKDAASAAIYGSRAAYGVILITTKDAQKNSPLRVSYSGSYTITRPTRQPKYLNSVDYIALHREADRNGQLSGGSTASFPFTVEDSTMAANYFADPANNPSGYPDPSNPSKYRYVGNTDWVKVLYPGWAPQQQHDISVSGGTGKTSFLGSLGFFDQKGTLKPGDEDYKRINPTLKISTEATSWLTLHLKAALNHVVSNEPNSGSFNQNSWIQGDSRPNMPVFNPNGIDYAGQGSWTNPVALMKQSGRDILTANDLWFTGGAVLTPVKHITINADYTFNNYSGFEQDVQKQFPEYGVDGIFLDYYPWTIPDATTEVGRNNNYHAINLYANYENTFARRHYFKLTVGYNQEYRHYKTVDTRAKNLIDPGTPFIGLNSDPKPSVTGSEYEWALNGLLYRLNYIYNNKYLLEIDGRYDGSSIYASGKRFVWSPSASAGWRISNEDFFKTAKSLVNDLKLRVSYGQLPNQYFDPSSPSDATTYPYIATLPTGTTDYIFGSQPSIYVQAPGLVSSGFTWEDVITKDAGIDFSLLKSRLSGSFDWYIRDTKNMLVGGQPLPAVLGTAPPLKNAANLRTKGWELSLAWNDHIGREFNYSARFVLSDYSATITKYDLNPTRSLDSRYVGQKFGEIWGLVTDGYFQTDAEAAAADQSQVYGGTLLAGDIRYKDLNGDKSITYGDNTVTNPGDRKIIGNSTPRYQYGLNLSMQYRNFSLDIFLQGVGKRDIMPSDNAFFGFYSEWSVPFAYMNDHWEPDHPNAYFPRLRFGGGGNFKTQTKYLQSAAYCRLKNISLGYNIPADILNRIRLQKLRIYVTGQNLFEITKLFKAYDPETIGFGVYPLSRAGSFGLQLGL